MNAILLPLLVVFLVVTVLGLISGKHRHGKPWALVLGIISGLVVLAFLFVHFNQTLVQAGMAGLIASSLVNIWLQRQCNTA